MRTQDLIRTLSADNGARERPVGQLLTIGVLAAIPLSLAAFFIELGIRPDAMTAMRNPFFDLKFAITASLALAAIVMSLHLSRPEASPARWAWLLAIPFGLLGVGIAADMTMPQRLSWTSRLVGSNSRICLTAIPALSLPLLAASLLALRRGAPSNPRMAGAFAGLLSAAIAATLYAAHCTDDSPLFVAVWYSIAIVLVTLAGALAGQKLLRY